MPYLHLSDRTSIGGWDIIPRREFLERDAESQQVFAEAPKYLDLYRVSGPSRETAGCFVRPPGRKVGGEVDRESLRSIRRAVLCSVLDLNEALDSNNPNAGHESSVSDNCLLYAHPYNDAGRVVVDYGTMIRKTVAGLNVNRPESPIAVGPEVHIPMFAPRIDDEYANALYAVLATDDDAARRMALTIDWLDVVWRNTDALDLNTRIVALRAAFEVLLNAGEGVGPGRAALARLWELRGARTPRRYTDREGNEQTKDMYDEEWWFSRFVWLRNKIMHGGAPSDDDYHHEGRLHHKIADEMLRRTIKRAVVAAGFPEDLLVDQFSRRLRRAFTDAKARGVPVTELPEEPRP